MRRRKERGTWGAILGWGLLAGALFAASGCTKKGAQGPPGPPEVLVTRVLQEDVPVYREWIGSLDGSVNAVIRAQVSGYLTAQDYKEGTLVKKGDPLFEIDPRPLQAALDQALAAQAKAEAAQLKAELDEKRGERLFSRKVISAQEQDQFVEAASAAKADTQAQRALVETARLNLGFTKIVAPVEGVAGIATAQIGDLVGPGTNPLTTVSQVDPIKAYVTVTEQAYIDFTRRYITAASRARHEEELRMELILADGSVFPYPGKFFAVDRQVDPTTGALRFAGLFPNPTRSLRPGQFCRVRARTEIRKGALLVPQRAVTELQGNSQVAVVNGEGKVNIRTVQLGERQGGRWIVTEGLHPGETVVVEGTQKTREGAAVTAKPWKAPPPSESPSPVPSF